MPESLLEVRGLEVAVRDLRSVVHLVLEPYAIVERRILVAWKQAARQDRLRLAIHDEPVNDVILDVRDVAQSIVDAPLRARGDPVPDARELLGCLLFTLLPGNFQQPRDERVPFAGPVGYRSPISIDDFVSLY
jgi:hypothetical protein